MRDTTDSEDNGAWHDLRMTARMTEPGMARAVIINYKSPENIATLRASLFSKRRRLPTLPHCIAVPSA